LRLPIQKLNSSSRESGEEEDRNDVPTLVTLDVEEVLLIKRSLQVAKAPYEESQGNKSLI